MCVVLLKLRVIWCIWRVIIICAGEVLFYAVCCYTGLSGKDSMSMNTTRNLLQNSQRCYKNVELGFVTLGAQLPCLAVISYYTIQVRYTQETFEFSAIYPL